MNLGNLKLKKLRAFMEVAEGKDATKTIGITYRTIHRYIQEVEILYGYELFEGVRKPKNLTPKGRALLNSAKRVFAELDKLK